MKEDEGDVLMGHTVRSSSSSQTGRLTHCGALPRQHNLSAESRPLIPRKTKEDRTTNKQARRFPCTAKHVHLQKPLRPALRLKVLFLHFRLFYFAFYLV